MSDMLKTFVGNEVDRKIQKEYPHLRYPAAVYAKVVSAREERGYYRYIIRILDKNRKEDTKFPEIPGVMGTTGYEAGDLVAVVFPYGDLSPFIIGRVV